MFRLLYLKLLKLLLKLIMLVSLNRLYNSK